MKKMMFWPTLSMLMLMSTAVAHEESERPVPPELTPIDEMPEFWRKRAEKVRQIYQKRRMRLGPVLDIPRCHVVLTMQAIIWGDPHLYTKNPDTDNPDRVSLLGPHPANGTWIVAPVNDHSQWKHPWQNGVYLAVPVSSEGERFKLSPIKVEPHTFPPGPQSHDYLMEIMEFDRNDGCPKYVEFLNLGNTGGPISDDPGHGGAGR